MRQLFIFIILAASWLRAQGQGLPVIRNYLSKDYHSTSINSDIEIGADGTVFIANFEGVLYYDNAEWRIIHTPGITRVTVVYRDQHDSIWVGGYNYFGKIQRKDNGQLYLRQIAKKGLFHGEVEEIWEEDGEVNFYVSNENTICEVVDNKVKVKDILTSDNISIGISDVISANDIREDRSVKVLTDTIMVLPFEDGLKAVVRKGQGVSIYGKKGELINRITEANGLCSNNVIYLSYNGRGTLWGVADEGIFALAVPSVYSRFTENEGLIGSVLSIEEFAGSMYVGTVNGLFRQEGKTFVRVGDIMNACWDLDKDEEHLMAATADGLYCITPDRRIRQLTNSNPIALLHDGNQYYCGEIDGVYVIQASGKGYSKIGVINRTKQFLKDNEGTIWLQTYYGEIWQKKSKDAHFKPYKKGMSEQTMATIVPMNGKVMVVEAESTKPFPYPETSYCDNDGVTWLTDNEGRNLYRWKDGKRLESPRHLLHPIQNIIIHTIFCRKDEYWLGTDQGVWIINNSHKDPQLESKPRLLFRSVTLGNDSILWGGYGKMPEKLPDLDSNERNLRFTFAVDYAPVVGTMLYRYRLQGGNWSAWAADCDAELNGLAYGSHTIDIQARMPNGVLTEVTSMGFYITPPFYLKWYMQILYLLLTILLVYAIFRYRLHRLNVEKQRLEAVVQERTAEVVKHKDEIEEKSKRLETALKELSDTQHQLIRQEKMATVGKLTQGLIDRILNPMNYINNFSKLSEGLVRDVEANIDDEKDRMDADNYEDTKEVLGMLRGNLQKVGEHGQSTTRTLKAMEEMLKDRSGGIVKMDLNQVFRLDEEIFNRYYAKDIDANHIRVVFDIPEGVLPINGNADQLSKTFMSLLSNGIYAVKKKVELLASDDGALKDYQPEVSLKVRLTGQKALIIIRDNGTGISEKIIKKIFDPFFTTKTTSEATGIGLYLSHEIIQNHNGDIHVESVKNEYSEFTIELPVLNE